jgi:hypothetical protein
VSYWGLAAATTLATFGAIACTGSWVVALAASAVTRRVERASMPHVRAGRLLAWRLSPAAAAVTVAFLLVLPTFLWFEPADTHESIAMTLAVLAGGGALILALAGWRAVSAWRATRALERVWRAHGRRVTIDAPLPVVAVDEPYPIVAVVGLRRPVLYVAQCVLDACPAHEVDAMVRHECAHVASRDNLKRLLLRAWPSLSKRGEALDDRWARAAEESADATAAAGDPNTALDLALALIRVARLASGQASAMPVSAFYLGGSIEDRIRRLLDCAPAAPLVCRRAITAARVVLFVTALFALAPAAHALIEATVRLLP